MLFRPAYMSLHALAEYNQYQKDRQTDLNSMFEAKLFALCYDEMLRKHFGAKLIIWLKAWPAKKVIACQQWVLIGLLVVPKGHW